MTISTKGGRPWHGALGHRYFATQIGKVKTKGNLSPPATRRLAASAFGFPVLAFAFYTGLFVESFSLDLFIDTLYLELFPKHFDCLL